MPELLPSFQLALKILQICGCNPLKQNWVSKILQIITLLSALILQLSMILEIVLNWKGIATIAKLNMISLVFAFLVKCISLIKNMSLLREILMNLDQLVPLNKYGSELNNQLLKYNNYVVNFIKLYLAGAQVSSVQFFSAPLFIQEYQVPFRGYEICDMSTFKCYLIHLIWQIVLVHFQFFPITLGYDGVFASLICYAFSAIELLKRGFKNLKIKSTRNCMVTNELNDLIDQHNVIIKFIKQLKKFLNGVLLVQFWTSLVGLILTMYMVASQGSSISVYVLLNFGMSYLLFALQLFLYCVCGTILIEQLNTIGDEIFATDWYLQTEIRNKLTFIIARCNYGDKLRAGKMIDVNLISYVNVLKNSISICMLLLTVGTQHN